MRIHHQKFAARPHFGVRGRDREEKGFIRQGTGNGGPGAVMGHGDYVPVPCCPVSVQMAGVRRFLRRKDVEAVRGKHEFQPVVGGAGALRAVCRGNIRHLRHTKQVQVFEKGGGYMQGASFGSVFLPENEEQMEILPLYPADMADVLDHERSHHERNAGT